MQLGSNPLDRLVIPDGTTVEEHDLVTDGDVVVGGQTTVEFGVRGRSVIAGERARFEGHIEAAEDCRLDMWCTVEDNVLVGSDAYLGERVHIDGELKVAGDLDIGDDVDIEDGFEANGWIVIRNPMPTIVFLFVYLSHLLHVGEEDTAADVLEAVTGEDADHEPVVIPRGARVSDDVWQVSTPATVGDDCRLHGNVRAREIEVGRDDTIFGSLRADGDVVVGRGTEIKGDVTTRDGDVAIGPGVTVWGDVVGEDVRLHENATVDGTIRADGAMAMHTEQVIDRPDETAAAMAEAAQALTDDSPDGEADASDSGGSSSAEATVAGRSADADSDSDDPAGSGLDDQTDSHSGDDDATESDAGTDDSAGYEVGDPADLHWDGTAGVGGLDGEQPTESRDDDGDGDHERDVAEPSE